MNNAMLWTAKWVTGDMRHLMEELVINRLLSLINREFQ
jgi:hypothetical protein